MTSLDQEVIRHAIGHYNQEVSKPGRHAVLLKRLWKFARRQGLSQMVAAGMHAAYYHGARGEWGTCRAVLDDLDNLSRSTEQP